MVVFGVVERFDGGDDALQVTEDLPVVVGKTVTAVGFGGGDQLGGLIGLPAVGGQELDGRLEVGTRQAGCVVMCTLSALDLATSRTDCTRKPNEVYRAAHRSPLARRWDRCGRLGQGFLDRHRAA
jgi:hypothetical protein